MDEPPSYSLQSILLDQSLLYFLVTAALLLLAAWISALEAAFFTLSAEELEKLGKSRDRREKMAANTLNEPRLLISALTACKYALLLGTAIIAMASVSWKTKAGTADMSIISWVLLIASLFAIVGVIIPKIYGASRARMLAVKYVRVARFLTRLLRPLVMPIITMSKGVERTLAEQREENSVEEFRQALQLATIDSEPMEGSREILEGIVNFGTLRVKNVMRGRGEISFIDVSLDFRQVISFIRLSGYSRIPVCDGSLNKIVGLLYVKDLLPFLSENASFDWRKLIRPAYFVHESKKIDFLLKDFQEKHVHIALVINPDGHTTGLITLEDIIEEIIGDINDEFDEIGSRYQKINENTWLFDGKTSLHDFCKVLKLDPSTFHPGNGLNESLSAMVMAAAGKFPSFGDRIPLGPLTFVIEAVDQKRIRKIRVQVNESRAYQNSR